MRAYLHRAFYDNMIGSNNTNRSNTVDSNRCLDVNSFENNNNNSSNNRYNARNRSQRYFRSLWSTTDHTESNISVNNFWNRTNRNRSSNSNNNNTDESTLARRVPVALSSHHYSMPYPAALPYPSETIYTEPVNATAILDGSYSLQFPGMFEMVDPCVEAYMASIQDNVSKERMKGSNRANNESSKCICDENNNNATTLSLVSDVEQNSNKSSSNTISVNDESNIDSANNNVNNNNMREVSTLSNERANTDHINIEAAVNIRSDINNNDINSINSSNQESNASLFSSFRQQTNIFDYDNENTRSLETENVSHAQHTIDSNYSNCNNTTNTNNNNENCNNDDGSNNSTDQNILSVIIIEPASIENRCKGKSKRHLLSRLFGLCKVRNNECVKRNDGRRCVYNYDNSIRCQSSVSSSLTSLESFEEEAPTTATDVEREAARNIETEQNTDNECQQKEEENEQTDRGDNDNHHNNDNINQEIDNASVNSVNANTIPSSQNVANYDRTNNNYNTNLHTCESYKVNVLEGGFVIFTDDFVRVHPASLIATITHAYKLTSPTTHLTSKTKEQMSRSRSRH